MNERAKSFEPEVHVRSQTCVYRAILNFRHSGKSPYANPLFLRVDGHTAVLLHFTVIFRYCQRLCPVAGDVS